jgi:hypothetical protein
MKNAVLKTYVTSLFLSMSGLAAADEVTLDLTELSAISGFSAISGAAVSVRAGSNVTGDVAAQAAVTIGAQSKLVSSRSGATNLFAGAAVTIGAGAEVGNIYAGAAADVAATAKAGHIKAGAAVTTGAPAEVGDIHAGAGITLGAGSTAQDVFAAAGITGAEVKVFNNGVVVSGNVESIGNVSSTGDTVDNEASSLNDINITKKLRAIQSVQDRLFTLPASAATDSQSYMLGTSMGSATIVTVLKPGIYEATDLNMLASSTIIFEGDADDVWILNISGALTIGANTTITKTPDGATVIWNVGGALNLGASTQFAGTAIVNTSINGATSDVTCGSLYALGAVAIGGIESEGDCSFTLADITTDANGIVKK